MLVERFEEMALATAFPACEDIEAARDACQEAFLMAWRLLPRLREPAAFGVWLKRLVRTQCARARRRPAADQRNVAEAAEPRFASLDEKQRAFFIQEMVNLSHERGLD